MDIYSYLHKDHKKVAGMLDKIVASNSDAERKRLFNEVKAELLLHAETEDATFYEALRHNKKTEEKIEHAEEEHDEIKKYLTRLSKLPIDSEKWIEQFGEFKHSVTHHVQEEEEGIFEKAKKVLTEKQAKELAVEMEALKRKKLDKAA